MLGGCASSGAADPAALEKAWVLESLGGTTALTPADPAVTSTLTLKDGEASGSGGVNSFGGSYTASSDGDISFGALNSTLMAGPEPAMKQETAFFKALADAKHFEFNQGKLVLSGTGNDTLAVLAPK
jgi:heat shock protein HslJ